MDRIEVSLANVIETIQKENLMMCVPEDVLKFVFFKIIEQLVILREAGASHGDIKSDNVMFSYSIDGADLSSADVQLIDFGCTGPNGQHYAATVIYAPLEIWRNTITDETSKTLHVTYASKSIHTQDLNTTKLDFQARKHGSKYDSWSTMVTIWEFINLGHQCCI